MQISSSLRTVYGSIALPPDVMLKLLVHATRIELALAQFHSLSPRELVVLGLVGTQAPLTGFELEQLLALPSSVVEVLISALEARHLIVRRESTADRGQRIALTAEGEKLVQSIREEDNRMVAGALDSLEESERTGFLKAAESMQRQLAKAIPNPPDSAGRQPILSRSKRSIRIRRSRENRRSGA